MLVSLRLFGDLTTIDKIVVDVLLFDIWSQRRKWRCDTRHNDSHHNDIMTFTITTHKTKALSVVMLNAILMNVILVNVNVILVNVILVNVSVILVNVILLNVIILNGIMFRAIRLSVVVQNVIIFSNIMLCVVLPYVIIFSVVLPNVISLSVVILHVMASRKFASSLEFRTTCGLADSAPSEKKGKNKKKKEYGDNQPRLQFFFAKKIPIIESKVFQFQCRKENNYQARFENSNLCGIFFLFSNWNFFIDKNLAKYWPSFFDVSYEIITKILQEIQIILRSTFRTLIFSVTYEMDPIR